MKGRKTTLFEEQAIAIFKELEGERITDNVDYISIPIREWDKIKEAFTVRTGGSVNPPPNNSNIKTEN